jgi:hypothetical protein
VGDSARDGVTAEQGAAAWAFARLQRLFCFVLFEKLPRFFEGEGVSVDLEFVFAGVFRDRDDMADFVAVLAEGLDDQIDVYHG